MPDLRELNNQGSRPPNPAPLTRDHEFYFEDGSAVFLVGNVLFKLQASLLASDSSKVTFKPTPTSEALTLFDVSDKSEGKIGTSDENPIKVPSPASETAFRALLQALLARPGSAAHRTLYEDIQIDQKHGWTLLWQYFSLAVMALCFNITDVARWIWPRIGIILKSARRFTSASLIQQHTLSHVVMRMLTDYETILEHEPDVARELLAFLRFTLSASSNNQTPGTQEGLPSNLEVCLLLYRKPPPPEGSVAHSMARGYIFIVLLSLGHQSDIWKNRMTRDERSVFYVAQAHLVSLGTYPDLELGWLHNPKRFGIPDQACPTCSRQFAHVWSESFGPLGTLNSPLPLQDVAKLTRLPQCRYLFADKARKPDWSCQTNCGEKMVEKMDGCLDRLFNEQLVRIYEELIT
ncbi:hypothetical protein FRC12_003026 [Ceratobasidium sp. 428]|nr:hypothetical protein FRC12_003026 [Ceratobasidium sp. 428]